MNLKLFLKEVDDSIAQSEKEELVIFIHAVARVLPENERGKFLDLLMKRNQKTQNHLIVKARKDTLNVKYQEFNEQFSKIEQKEVKIKAILNEGYDDWYCDMNEEFYYEDSNHIGNIIENAVFFIEQCIDVENYQEGYDIAIRLMSLEIEVDNEYNKEVFTVYDMDYYDLIKINMKKYTDHFLYITYLANPLSKRCEALFKMINEIADRSITLENIMQKDKELEDIDEFIDLWIDFLGKRTSSTAQQLMKEAFALVDEEKQIQCMWQYYSWHPALYNEYLEIHKYDIDKENLFQIGKEALEKIDAKYIVRSEIAKKAASLAIDLELPEERDQYIKEAFYSHTNVTNYLRIIHELNEFMDITDILKHTQHTQDYMSSSMVEQTENIISQNTFLMLRFFNQEFEDILNQEMSKQETFSRNLKFTQYGIGLFCLLLNKNESLDSGCAHMCQEIISESHFDDNDYQSALDRIYFYNHQELFMLCFHHWKQFIQLSQQQEEDYLEKIENLIYQRVQSVLKGKFRADYYECAAVVAALGEVKESRGLVNGKQLTLKEYKMEYPRFLAFHEELETFGMID